MKKKIVRIFLILILFISLEQKVYAATASASINVSTSSTVVGNSGTATLTISSNEAIGQIYGTFTCGALGSKDLTYSVSDSPIKSKTYTINFKASSPGIYTCEVKNLEIGTLETLDWPSVSVSPKTINVVKTTSSSTTIEKKEYSSDNTLKSLSIDDYELTPIFNKDITEYKLTVDESVEKIKINATKNNNKASISGDGEVNLSSGENIIEIKVTAENGNEKIYKIIVLVEDLNPINVKIGKNEYTIVKKNNNLKEKLEYYEEVKIKIDDQDVVAYTNELTKTTLVLLKSKDGIINYYIYDDDNNTYELYKYIKINNITLQLLDTKEKLKNYKEYKTTINEEKINIFKLNNKAKVGLIYGKNILTNNVSFYQYDELENTLSKYYTAEIELYKLKNKKLEKYIVIGIVIFSIIAIIAVIISILKGKKRKKR